MSCPAARQLQQQHWNLNFLSHLVQGLLCHDREWRRRHSTSLARGSFPSSRSTTNGVCGRHAAAPRSTATQHAQCSPCYLQQALQEPGWTYCTSRLKDNSYHQAALALLTVSVLLPQSHCTVYCPVRPVYCWAPHGHTWNVWYQWSSFSLVIPI